MGFNTDRRPKAGGPYWTPISKDEDSITQYVRARLTVNTLLLSKLEAYKKTANLLQFDTEECLMVACHSFDLNAAKNAGYKTAFVKRHKEWGENTKINVRENAKANAFYNARCNMTSCHIFGLCSLSLALAWFLMLCFAFRCI